MSKKCTFDVCDNIIFAHLLFRINSITKYIITGCSGPGYRSPLDAFKNGPREKLLYVITVQPNLDEPHGDYLSTIDVDPQSPTYCQVRLNFRSLYLAHEKRMLCLL